MAELNTNISPRCSERKIRPVRIHHGQGVEFDNLNWMYVFCSWNLLWWGPYIPIFDIDSDWFHAHITYRYTLTFWTLEISRVRMQTPGLPVTWGKIPGFSNKSWVCRKKPGFFLFCRNFQFFLGWGGRCLAIHMIKLTYSVPFLAEGHNSTWLIYA